MKLRVAVIESRFAAFYTGLVGLAAGLGFSAFLLAYGTWASIVYSGRSVMPGLLMLFMNSVVLGVCLLLWIWNSRRIRQALAPVWWGLAAGCWVLSLVTFLLFAVLIG